MKAKKGIIIGVLAFALLLSIVLLSGGGDRMQAQIAINNISRIIKRGEVSDISMTIHYLSPSLLTYAPITIEMLLSGDSDKLKTVISVGDLSEHTELFERLSETALIPYEWTHEVYEDVRLVYVLESTKNGKLLEVAWGGSGLTYVNGFPAKEQYAFLDVVIPFLPDDDVGRDWKEWLSKPA